VRPENRGAHKLVGSGVAFTRGQQEELIAEVSPHAQRDKPRARTAPSVPSASQRCMQETATNQIFRPSGGGSSAAALQARLLRSRATVIAPAPPVAHLPHLRAHWGGRVEQKGYSVGRVAQY
jgi:hypothetical protein